jgi:phosphoglycolate phosphatase-like HAD superfamily hydrolase
MRRTIFTLAVFAAALSAAAQYSPQRLAVPSPLLSDIDRLEPDIQRDAAILQRDAFVASQLAAATGDLHDFQRTVAVERARDRINAAIKRMYETKPQSTQRMELLEGVRQLLDHAHEQGATADLEGLQREIMKRSEALQYELFKELDQARKERQMMSDAVARLLRMTDNLDGAMTVALGSTFDYFRAGGR